MPGEGEIVIEIVMAVAGTKNLSNQGWESDFLEGMRIWYSMLFQIVFRGWSSDICDICGPESSSLRLPEHLFITNRLNTPL